MKKLLVFVGTGIGIGYLLGSRAGRDPYERLEGGVRNFAGRPEVHDRLDAAQRAASQQWNGLASKAPGKLPTWGNAPEPTQAESTQAEPTQADPTPGESAPVDGNEQADVTLNTE